MPALFCTSHPASCILSMVAITCTSFMSHPTLIFLHKMPFPGSLTWPDWHCISCREHQTMSVGKVIHPLHSIPCACPLSATQHTLSYNLLQHALL